jgi:hypothetical protein
MTISPNKWELDVQSYLNLCNISAATPRQQIRDFAKGVNDLGLWNSMVCWPLRSSQNYGSGTTAFSLGVLGTFNGTLTNGPTWGVDGITFVNASSQYITTNSSINLSTADTLIAAVAKFTDSGTRDLVGTGTSSVSSGFLLAQGSATSLAAQAQGTVIFFPSINHGATQGSFESYAALNSNSGTTVTVSFGASTNSSTQPTHVVNSGNHPFIIGHSAAAAAGSRYMQGDVALALLMRGAQATIGNWAILTSLYKQTLGTGLGLP